MIHWLFELTRACNRTCAYCYNADRRPPAAEHLESPHLESLLDRLFAWREPERVTVIGGEPLMVDHLEDVVSHFCRRGVAVAVSTNGLLLSEARLDSLLDAGVGGFEVSLDSLDPAVHRALTGAGGVERVREVVARLVRSGVPVTVGSMLTRANAGSVGELLDFCFALSVRRVVLAQLAPVGFGRDRVDLALSTPELEEVLSCADERSARFGLHVGIGLPVEPCRIDLGRFPNLWFEACRCGRDKWLLEPSGDVRVCELSAECAGNLMEVPMSEIESSVSVRRFRTAVREPACAGCADWEVCGGGCRFLEPVQDHDQSSVRDTATGTR